MNFNQIPVTMPYVRFLFSFYFHQVWFKYPRMHTLSLFRKVIFYLPRWPSLFVALIVLGLLLYNQNLGLRSRMHSWRRGILECSENSINVKWLRFRSQITYVWSRPWSLGTCLFLLNRYLPFIDGTIGLNSRSISRFSFSMSWSRHFLFHQSRAT